MSRSLSRTTFTKSFTVLPISVFTAVPMPSRKESKTAAAWKQVGVESDLDGLTLGSAQQDERRETITAQERNTQASNGKATKQQQLNEIQERVVEERDTAMIDAEDRAADPTRSRATTPASDAETVSTEQLSECQPDHTLPRLPRSTFVEVPVLARYELRDLPSDGQGKFGNDQGIFATQDIKQGMRIMSERPILTLMAPGDQLDELMAAYNRLPKTDQKRIWNLRPATPDASDQLHTLRYLTDRLAADLSNLLLKLRSDRTEEEQAVLDKMTPKLENAMTVWRIAARWHLNRCSMTNLPMEHRSSLPTGTPITGLFIERAQIRHSCVPNCFASFDANLDRMNVHVVRDIAAGEELTLAAFADSNYYHTAADRREELAAWGLTCNCEACDETHPRFRVHESARQRAHARAVLLNDMLTRLENEELPEVRSPLPLLPSSSPSHAHITYHTVC